MQGTPDSCLQVQKDDDVKFQSIMYRIVLNFFCWNLLTRMLFAILSGLLRFVGLGRSQTEVGKWIGS